MEEARTLMEKMRMEERQMQQQQGWSRERRQPVESGPRPYSGRGGAEKLNDWEESGRKREEGGWRTPGGVGRSSSALTLDSFLLPEGPRPVKGRGGGKKGPLANPGTLSSYRIDEKSEWNEKEWSSVKSTAVGAERGGRPMAKPEPTPCKASCYWRSQDSIDGPTQVMPCSLQCKTILLSRRSRADDPAAFHSIQSVDTLAHAPATIRPATHQMTPVPCPARQHDPAATPAPCHVICPSCVLHFPVRCNVFNPPTSS